MFGQVAVRLVYLSDTPEYGGGSSFGVSRYRRVDEDRLGGHDGSGLVSSNYEDGKVLELP